MPTEAALEELKAISLDERVSTDVVNRLYLLLLRPEPAIMEAAISQDLPRKMVPLLSNSDRDQVLHLLKAITQATTNTIGVVQLLETNLLGALQRLNLDPIQTYSQV
jgi:hypothetical protein